MKIRLLDDAVLEGDRAVQCGGQAIADAALHLRTDDIGIHRDAAIDGAYDAIDAEAAITLDRDFGNLRDERIERFVDGDTATPFFARLAGRERCSPTRLGCGEFEHAKMARMAR